MAEEKSTRRDTSPKGGDARSGAKTTPVEEDVTDQWRRLLVDPVVLGLLSYDNAAKREGTSINGALRRWQQVCEDGQRYGLTPEAAWENHYVPGADTDVVLDLGCGDAFLGTKLTKPGNVQYFGIDKNAQRLKTAPASKYLKTYHQDLEAATPFKSVLRDLVHLPRFILAIRVFDYIGDPAKLLAEIGQLYGPGKRATMLVVTSNLRYFRKSGHPADFGQIPGKAELVECRDGEMRFLRSRTEMRRVFRDAGFHIYDEASPLLPAGTGELKGFVRKEGDHAVAPWHVWLLGIHSTKRVPVEAAEIQEWLKELEPGREARGTAHLLLSAISKKLKGVHWRTIPADAPIVYKHNTGGQVYIVRNGRFGAYHPGTEPAPDMQPRVVLDPNEAFGELEVFDHKREHDRRYVASVYALPPEKKGELFSNVLVLPEGTVQYLMTLPKVLGNPMLVDLRTKSLEASLRHQAPYVGKSKPAYLVPGAQEPREVEPTNVSMVASILALALESDREKGLYALDGRRVLYIDKIHDAPSRLFQKFPDAAMNGALEYLQAAGVIGLLRPVPSEGTAEFKAKRAARLRTEAKERGVDEKLLAHSHSAPALRSVFERFLKNPFYCVILVEAEMSLRKFLLEPSQGLFEEMNAVIAAKGALSLDSLAFWHDEMVKVSMDFWRKRIEADAWWYDSLGAPLAAGRHSGYPAKVR